MLSRVVRAPVSYFETTPLGRIITRFTYDIEVIEVTLTQNISVFMIATSWYVAGVTLMIVILPYMALIIFPITAVYWLLLLHYRKSGADLQRLDAASRSPIQAMISEGEYTGGCVSVTARSQVAQSHRLSVSWEIRNRRLVYCSGLSARERFPEQVPRGR